MPDSYGVSFNGDRARFPNIVDAPMSTAARPMAMMTWTRMGKYNSE